MWLYTMPMITIGTRKRPTPQQKLSTQQRGSTNHGTGRTPPRESMGNQALIAKLQKSLEEETSSSNQEEALTSKMLKSRKKLSINYPNRN